LHVALFALPGSFQLTAPQLEELKQQPLTQLPIQRVRVVPVGQVALNWKLQLAPEHQFEQLNSSDVPRLNSLQLIALHAFH
jgi:hypothetical protein